MKKFFKQNLLIIIPTFLVMFILLIFSFIRIEYEIISPGFLNKVENVISVENSYESVGSFNTTSVYVNEKCTIMQYLLAHLSNAVIIEPVSELVDGTSVRNSKSGLIQKNNISSMFDLFLFCSSSNFLYLVKLTNTSCIISMLFIITPL